MTDPISGGVNGHLQRTRFVWQESMKRVVIDTDPGIDDALALWLAFRSPELRVEAVTTVAGNAPIDRTTLNALRLIDLLHPTPRPLLARGREGPLQKGLITAASVHGRDGLGDLTLLMNEAGNRLYADPVLPAAVPEAKEVIIELAARYGDELTVITLGPLTNLADALLADPKRVRKLGNVVIMGGAVGVPGNVTPAAEFNIFVDPHAAHLVFNSGLPICQVPLDVTRKVRLTGEAVDRLAGNMREPMGRFLKDVTRGFFDRRRRLNGEPYLTLHDPLAVGAAVDPSFVQTTALHVDVETQGLITEGMTLADRRPMPGGGKARPNVQAALEVDAKRFLAFFEERLCRKSS